MIYPIKNYRNKKYPNGDVTQWFGENPELYQKASKNWAIQIKYHNGIDIVAPYGTPILATTDQIITGVKNNPNGYGRHIRSIDKEYEHTYGHLSKINVKVGDEVKEGEVIGLMGNSGFVISGATPYWNLNPYAGTHLHYGLRKLGKKGASIFISSLDIRYYIVNYPGDAAGAIDPVKIWEQEIKSIEIKDKNIIKKQLTIISLMNQVVSLLQKIINLKGRKL